LIVSIPICPFVILNDFITVLELGAGDGISSSHDEKKDAHSKSMQEIKKFCIENFCVIVVFIYGYFYTSPVGETYLKHTNLFPCGLSN